MKLSEAKQIVSEILKWQFVLMGITQRKDLKQEVDLKQYSLEDLIKANKLVKSNNKRKVSLQKHYQEKNGKANSINIQTILADRLISGVHFALHFEPNSDIHVIVNDIGVGCTKIEKYE